MATDTTDSPTPTRSLTADFFSTPARTPSPPPSLTTTTTTTTTTRKTASLLARIHPSRIFPSRYTSTSARDDEDHYHKPEPTSPVFLELTDEMAEGGPGPFSFMPTPHVHPPRALSSLSSLSTSSSSESTHSSSSIGIPESNPSHRLPTPPPPAFASSTTPRPTHVEPRYTKHLPDHHHVPLPLDSTTKTIVQNENKIVDVDPATGCIITFDPPLISLPNTATHSSSSPILTITPPPDLTSFPSPLQLPPPLDRNQTITPSSSSLSLSTDTLRLIHPLGQGAFSCVWLAEDLSPIPLTLKSKKSIRESRRKANLVASGNLSRKSSGKSITTNPTTDNFLNDLSRLGSLRMQKLRARVKGTRPVGFNTRFVDERHGEMGTGTVFPSSSSGVEMASPPISSSNSTGSTLDDNNVTPVVDVKIKRKKSKKTRMVAVKLTPRHSPAVRIGGKEGKEEEEERTRVGFVREVEILKHTSHPNITVLLEHLSTPSYHILILPYLPGGDLLGLVNSDVSWSKLGENVLRRIWCELCKAVGWMHGVGLVHRDIKLENILLTTKAFSSLTSTSPRPTLSTLPESPTPLIKLTDFGLSRFIEVDETTGEGELLWTRCGSEAYAAPELVLGTGSVRAQQQARDAKRRRFGRRRRGYEKEEEGEGSDEEEEDSGRKRGFYDARETDAWACGVVLYALVARRLPFGEGVGEGVGGQGRIGGDGEPGYGHGHGRGSILERRQWLMKIARGEYEWPTTPELVIDHSGASSTIAATTSSPLNGNEIEEKELVGQQLIHSTDAKRIVSKLMVRDPRKRARIMDLWEDEWMWGPGGGLAVGITEAEWRERERSRSHPDSNDYGGRSGDDGIGLGIDFGESGPPVQFTDQGCVEDGREEVVTIDVDYARQMDTEGFVDEDMGYNDVEEEVGEAGEEIEGEVEEVCELVDGEEGWLLDQEGIGSVARQELV